MSVVLVFTGNDLETMRQDGGSGHWTAAAWRIEQAQYLVCVRNRREQWAAEDVDHGTAFLVAKITTTVPSTHAGRLVIGLSEFAEIKVPDAWRRVTQGQRFPVAYKEDAVFADLGIKLDELMWHPFLKSSQVTVLPESAPKSPIAEAKEFLATRLGIEVSAIEITIRT